MTEIKEIYYISRTGSGPAELLADTVFACFEKKAYVYAVLDYAVILGTYEVNTFQLCIEGELTDKIPFEYVRELIVFDEDKELRAVRQEKDYFWRLLEDHRGDEERPLSCRDQVYKLWGKKEASDQLNGWTVLSSKRGSRIYVPGVFRESEIGLRVRQYLEFPDATDEKSLVVYEDERLCGFCGWNSEEGEGV